jgi:hypothetical protein
VQSIPSHRRLLILACSATKRAVDGRVPVPARESYRGPIWQTLSAVDNEERLARVGFVSARLGFRHADYPIESYDARMTREVADAMIAGGKGTRWPRPPRGAKHGNYGIHPGCQIATLVESRDEPFVDVALVGGHLYLDVMRSFVTGFQDLGFVTRDARITEVCSTIGFMRQGLRRWLLEGASGDPEGRDRVPEGDAA